MDFFCFRLEGNKTAGRQTPVSQVSGNTAIMYYALSDIVVAPTESALGTFVTLLMFLFIFWNNITLWLTYNNYATI